MVTKRRNISKFKSKTLSKSNKGSSSRKYLIKFRKNRLKTRKMKGGAGSMLNFFNASPQKINSNEIALINNTQLIGKGEFGCAFKKNNNIIKISLFKEENKNELDINKFLKDENEKHPDLNLSKKISILINYAIYTYNKKDELIQYNEGYNGGYNGYENKILEYINNCDKNLENGFMFNEMNDNQFLIQEMSNSGTSLSSYIEKLLKNETNKSYDEIIDILKTVINKSLSALKTLHSLNIVHRDLHLDNILIDTQGDCRIIDFGKSFILTVKDGIINQAIDEINLKKFAPNFTPECVFLLNPRIMSIAFPNYIHIYNKTQIETQIEKCTLKSSEFKNTYFNSINNLIKLDLYMFGYYLDKLLYPEIDDKDHYNRNTNEYIRNTPALELEGILNYSIIDTFIEQIANIDYEHRELLYEI